MCEFHLGFSEKLLWAAGALCREHGLHDVDTKRTVCYLSLLACEIALKSGLEKAGQPLRKIESRKHDLSGLLADIGQYCEIEKSMLDGSRHWMPATEIRSKELSLNGAVVTLGKLLDDAVQQTSRYPNEIRYGEIIRHYPPEVVLDTAEQVVDWVRANWNHLRIRATP